MTSAAIIAAASGVAGLLVGVVLGHRLGSQQAPRPVAAAPARAPATQETIEDPPPQAPGPPPDSPADRTVAERIAAYAPAQRDEALCAIEAQADPNVRFALLERSPDRFQGHLWVASGRAIQVQDIPGGTGSFMLVSMDSYGGQIAALYAFARPADNVVANRRVRFYGRIAGEFTYETRGGQTMTVPRVATVAVVKSDEAPRCPRRSE